MTSLILHLTISSVYFNASRDIRSCCRGVAGCSTNRIQSSIDTACGQLDYYARAEVRRVQKNVLIKELPRTEGNSDIINRRRKTFPDPKLVISSANSLFFSACSCRCGNFVQESLLFILRFWNNYGATWLVYLSTLLVNLTDKFVLNTKHEEYLFEYHVAK